jgi:drug/metabolite transporter (DMT)-like permease
MTAVPPAVFGLLTAACWGLSDFLSRRPARRIGYYLTASYLQLVGLTEISAYVLVLAPASLSKLGSNGPVLAANLLIGVATFFSLTFLLRGFSRGNMSIVSPVASTYPVITIFLSALFLGETVAGIQAFGVAVLLGGIILAGINLRELRGKPALAVAQSEAPLAASSSADGTLAKTALSPTAGPQSSSRWFTRGLGSAVSSCVLSGVLLFGLGFVTPAFGSALTVLVIRVASTAASFALIKPLGQKFQLPNLRVVPWIVVVGSLDLLGLVLFNLGILSAGNSLPIVTTISGMATVLTIILAGGLYREKLDAIQYVGVTVLLLGLALVLYF